MSYKLTTQRGYNFYHVTSAFQKCIRRGLEHEALYWGTELYLSGFEEYTWFRIRVIASEDIGIANSELIVIVQALYLTWEQFKKKKNKHHPERLPFIHALLVLVRSDLWSDVETKEEFNENYLKPLKQDCDLLPESLKQPEKLIFGLALKLLIESKKSRLVDNKLCYYFDLRNRIAHLEFPDFVFDCHTKEGKKLGRGNDHFFDHSAHIENPNLNDVPDEFSYRDFIRYMYRNEGENGQNGQFIKE